MYAEEVLKLKYVLAALMLFVAQSAAARIYVVAVGVADYRAFKDGIARNLTLPLNDANEVANLFSRKANAACQLLKNSKATRDNILSAIRDLFRSAQLNDIVILFFSGHGYADGFCAYDKILSFSDVRDAMAKVNCKNKMIFADACYSGGLRSGKSTASPSALRNGNVMLFLSSRDNEKSIERSGMRNAYFTAYLLSGLRGKADANGDKVITARELFRYVHSGVVKVSSGKQHPVMWGKFSDHMPVMFL